MADGSKAKHTTTWAALQSKFLLGLLTILPLALVWFVLTFLVDFLSWLGRPLVDGLGGYFGSVIKYTFFDDVGFFPDEHTWNPAVAARFEQLTGKPAALYYPALWEDIGPDTAAARIGFFKARAEILGETFPKMIADWARAHGVKVTGHAPGNYDLQPTDMYGDPFKFYAHTR